MTASTGRPNPAAGETSSRRLPEDRAWSGRLLVVGTGLIGTSIALAARRAGAAVWLRDEDEQCLQLAVSMGAGEPAPSDLSDLASVDLAIVATPPAAIAQVIHALQQLNIAATISHTSSTQTEPQREIETIVTHMSRIVGGHPIAGREVSGPAGASPDLFADRPWVVCPMPTSAPEAVDAVTSFVTALGADPVVLSAEDHDRLLAQVSHAPQLVASALAAALRDLPESAALAGTGIRDATRLADSPAPLWAEIVAANAGPVADALERVVRPLADLITALRAPDDAVDGATAGAVADAVSDLMRQGQQGRAMLPGKHGRPARALATVHVVIPDEPGALARLFQRAADGSVNIEDVRVEHVQGQPSGVVELAVGPDDRDRLLAALTADGWRAVAGAHAPG